MSGWGSLSSFVVGANTIESLMRGLDRFMDEDDEWY